MAKRSTVLLVTAPSGSGKSYRRCAHYLTQEFLPHEFGTHISNFPIKMDALCEYMARYKGIGSDVIADRVQLIPEEILLTWRSGKSGPWEYFADRDLADCHIAIDEIHNYVGRYTKKDVKQRWSEWLGELRHMGATIEFISQAPEKIAKEIEIECEKRLFLVNLAEQRDPFFGVRRADWQELRAKLFRGKVEHLIEEQERRLEFGKWVVVDVLRLKLDPELFKVYDSFSAPQKGGKASSRGYASEGDRRSMWALLWYVFRTNSVRLVPRLLVGVVGCWLILGGGLGFLIEKGMSTVLHASSKDQSSKVDQMPASLVAPVPGSPRVAGSPGIVSAAAASGPVSVDAAHIAFLEKELEASGAALALQAAAQRKLLDDLSKVVAMSSVFAVLASGDSVAVGDELDGSAVAELDLARSRVVLADGRIVGLRRSGVSGAIGAYLGTNTSGASSNNAAGANRRSGAATQPVGKRS